MFKRAIGIIGAGTWGITLACILSNAGHSVSVWSALEKEIQEYQRGKPNSNLPQLKIPSNILFTNKINEVCAEKAVIIFAVPSPYIRETARRASAHIPGGQLIVSVAKGIEADTLYMMSDILKEEICGENKSINIVALSGPTHAEEVAQSMPTAIVAACENPAHAEAVQDLFSNTCLRVYTNPDIRGVELCGALKNIIALASGIASGLGYGDNTRAALITRGMAEITRLGLAMGCKEHTFAGLAGIGDLIVTATSDHSRNNRAGKMIGEGHTVANALKSVGMVVEGVNALPAAMQLANYYNVDLPLISSTNNIIFHGADPANEVSKLMMRERKME